MRNYEIVQLLESVQNEFKDLAPFFESIASIAANRRMVDEYVRLIAEGGANVGGYALQLHAELAGVSQVIAKLSARKFYDASHKLRTILIKVNEINPYPANVVKKLVDEVEKLLELYDLFLSAQSGSTVAPLIGQAVTVNDRLADFISSSEFFGRMVGYTKPKTDEVGTLSLFFSSDLTFREFIVLLNAIESIYSELCQLLSVSESNSPLQITKIESGSLWASIFGNSKVIALMDDLLRSSAHFVYRNYTKEGRMSAIPSRLESLDRALDFTLKLKEAGVDVAAVQDEILKGAALIAKDLTRLLENQSSITINNDTIYLAGNRNEPQLGYRELKQLPNGTTPMPKDLGD